MINSAGGRDAGTAMRLAKPFTPLTSEALVQSRADIILMTTTGLASVGGIDGLLEVPGVAQTPRGGIDASSRWRMGCSSASARVLRRRCER